MPRVSLSWVVVLGLLSAIGPLCTDFYLPALPEITEQLSATGTQTQLSLTAALLGLGLGQMFFGPLSDRIGRRKPLALSLLLFIFSSAMCAVTQDINLLIAWRFLPGWHVRSEELTCPPGVSCKVSPGLAARCYRAQSPVTVIREPCSPNFLPC